eukprot:GILJ01004362.1.p1 GENE.GILJ01004362.1~~GILJ01004362.1.p1  ORF type:complete len:551 (-),score=53.45 GILJ01004362.1:1454-3106(-)
MTNMATLELCKSSQEDEMLALESIMDADFQRLDLNVETNLQAPFNPAEYAACVCLTIRVDVPEDFVVLIPANLLEQSQVFLNSPQSMALSRSDSGSSFILPIEHLPPLHLQVFLPALYPLEAAPQFVLSCDWLTPLQMASVANELDAMYQASAGEVVLFHWVTFLRSDLFSFLGINGVFPFRPIRTVSQQAEDSVVYGNDDGTSVNMLQSGRIVCPDWSLSNLPLLLSDIATYNAQRRHDIFTSSEHQCSICFDFKAGTSFLRLHSCRHFFCRVCLGGHCSTLIQDGAVSLVTCPDTTCRARLLPTEVKEVVSEVLYEKFERFLLALSLDMMEDVVWCPDAACGFPVISDRHLSLGVCNKCGFSFCTSCQKSWHPGQTCSGTVAHPVREKKAAVVSTGVPVVINTTVLQIGEKMEGSHELRLCPFCRFAFYRFAGCDHMTCGRCFAAFDYQQSVLVSRKELQTVAIEIRCPGCQENIADHFAGKSNMSCDPCRLVFCIICGCLKENQTVYHDIHCPAEVTMEEVLKRIRIDKAKRVRAEHHQQQQQKAGQ